MFGQSTGLESLIHRPQPSPWQLFFQRPCVFLAETVYKWHSRRLSLAPRIPENHLSKSVSVVCISDTHNVKCSIPEGDILIHAGDLTQSGTFKELQATISWLRDQTHPVKIVIGGNHDLGLDETYHKSSSPSSGINHSELEWGDIQYLQDGSTTVVCPNGRHLKVYGSPKSPRHGNWAFQYPREQDVWSCSVPDDTDILITHTPPRAHLDLGRLGCSYLLRELWRVHPLLHVFGHVHAGYGKEELFFDNVQLAYERVLAAEGGLWNLWRMLVCICSSWSQQHTLSTQLVNASIVGGLRDNLRREPIKVYI